jgi:hypothetical protein
MTGLRASTEHLDRRLDGLGRDDGAGAQRRRGCWDRDAGTGPGGGSRKHVAYLLIEGQPARPPTTSSPPSLGAPFRSPTTPRPRPRPDRAPPPPGHHRRWPGFPHAAQAIRITRRVRPLGGQRWRTVTVSAVTNLTAQAQPAPLRTAGAATGTSRRCTTSATSPSPRTPPRAPGNTPWGMASLCNPWPSASCASTAGTTSPPRRAATPATPPESCHCSAAPAHEPATPALCRGPGGQASPIKQGRSSAPAPKAAWTGAAGTCRAEFRGLGGARGRGIPRNQPQELRSRHGFPASGRRSAQAVAALAGPLN